jgi:hypothetical protein
MTGLTWAHEESQYLKNAPKAYLHNLNLECAGIVESTVVNVIILKLYYPEKDFEDICERLEELAVSHSRESIRFKAFIALNYIKYGENFDWIGIGIYEQGENLYENFFNRLDEMQYAMKISPKPYFGFNTEPTIE